MIDAHQHFWRYTPEEYGWINESMSGLRRDFLPADLRSEIQNTDITGVISVQARQTLAETRWLLDLAASHDFIRAVVGWVPLTDPNLEAILNQLTKDTRFKGVRHVLQSEAEPYVLRDDFNRGIRLLKNWDLIYDILVFEHQLPYVIQFVQRHPDQIFVLDHIAKPKISRGILEPWRQNIRGLAKHPLVYCKLSGMATEAAPGGGKEQDFQPYFDVIFEAFGPSRVLFGSDWPVCLTQTSYQKWMSVVRSQIAGFTSLEQQSIMGVTAAQIYRLAG